LAKTLHTERHRKLRELLIAQRKAAGLMQTVLAERLGKPPSYVAISARTFWSTWILPLRSASTPVSRSDPCCQGRNFPRHQRQAARSVAAFLGWHASRECE
jgi:hypothetical protein